jgi:hypothetical protein
MAFKHSLRSGRAGGTLIKGNMSDEAAPGLFPGFSASGQDVWVDCAHESGPGIVLSAVGARCGKAFRADGQWTAVANTHVLKPRAGFDRDYLWFVVNNEDWWERGGSAQPYVRVPASLARRWAFPPYEVQRQIAGKLHWRASSIDSAIAKKARLIELLDEKRQALITQAVTGGAQLDGTALLPDWTPKLPPGWRLARLKELCDVRRSGAWGEDPDEEGGTLVARTADIKHGFVEFSEMPRRALSRAEVSKAMCKANDVIVVKSSGSATNVVSGKVALVRQGDPPFAFSNFLLGLRPRVAVAAPEFIHFFLGSALVRQRVLRMVSTTTYPNLQVGEYLSMMVTCPPVSEQRRIGEELTRACAGIDEAADKIARSISLLSEYRQALITAAVTGQIDVTKEPE